MAPNDTHVTLHSGAKMPKIGLGTWAQTNAINRDQHDPKALANAVKVAVESGYRHIDTAWAYFNEKELGVAFKELFDAGTVKREELFVVTKLYAFFFHKEDVERTLREQLKDLQLDYVDMYLMHFPCGIKPDPKDPTIIFPVKPDGTVEFDVVDHLETWTALEGCVEKGLAKHIGVSNFSIDQIQNLLDNAKIKPATHQVECHAYWPQREMKAFCDKNGIALTAYSPIGSPGAAQLAVAMGKKPEDVKTLMAEPVVKAIADKLNKSPAQVLLRYLYQRGIVVIPKSTSADRIKANAQITDWALPDEDMKALGGLESGRLLGNLPFLKDHPQYPYSNDKYL